ncbi:GGDEF domain-containing protein [Deinococcus sp. Marseille-Q6407]|uniref:GGDEF domain-containing protein n=1 Tax=Deinococcus sp. Marseille-Q6407 TaxID=2969223 RepID=UPI0021BE0221|nr:GGDEF domain-containing protein [Deinococcus sp. Marseille-Q6407]
MNRPPPLSRTALLPLAALLLGQTAWTLLRGLGPQVTGPAWPGSLLSLGVLAASVLLAGQLWRRRGVPVTFLLAFLAQFGGDAALTALDLRGLPYPAFSSADIFYLGYYLLMTAALLGLLPAEPTTRRQAGRALDGLIIAGTIGIVLWERLLGRLLDNLQGPFGLLNFSYVLLDLLVLGLSMVLLQVQRQYLSHLLLGVGLTGFVIADILYLDPGRTYQPATLPDLLWSWGIALQAAALWPLNRRPAQPATAEPLLRLLPYAAALVVCVILALTLPADSVRSQGILWGTLAVVAMVTARQWLAARDSQDLTRELQHSRAQLEYLAYHDELTGLSNRTALTQFFGYGLGDTEPYAIFSLDLNGFKEINDTYGHTAGDRMLQHVAGQLQQAVPAPGRIFRWGGDEFVVVMPGLTEAAQAGAFAQQLQRSVAAPLQQGQRTLQVDTSVGYALGRSPQNYEALLGQADQQMYCTKRRRR